MGPSLANKNKGGISAHDVCRSIPRTKLLTAVVCNSISHPCAPPAHRQVVSRSAGRSLAALAVAVTCEMADTSAAPVPGACGVNRGNVNTSTGSPCLSSLSRGGQGSACSPPSRGITRFIGAVLEFGKAAVSSRQGGDKRLLFLVCFLNVFKCHICFL